MGRMPDTTRGFDITEARTAGAPRMGSTMVQRRPVNIKRIENQETVRAELESNIAPAGPRSNPARTLPPSSGGTGSMLNTASSTLSCNAVSSSRADEVVQRHTRSPRAEPKQDRGQRGEDEIARWPGRRNQHDISAASRHRADRADRHRLGPSDERKAAEHRDEREQDRADRIDVHRRVERHPAESQTPSDPREGRPTTRGPLRARSGKR